MVVSSLIRRGQRSNLPIEVLSLLQRNHYIDRFVKDGGGKHRVWYEKGVEIRKVRKQQVSFAALWAGKRRESNVEFILETVEGYKTDREARMIGLGGVVCYRLASGVIKPKNIL